MKLLLLSLGAVSLMAAAVPAVEWAKFTPAKAGLDETNLAVARDCALTGEGSGCVILDRRLVRSWGISDSATI